MTGHKINLLKSGLLLKFILSTVQLIHSPYNIFLDVRIWQFFKWLV